MMYWMIEYVFVDIIGLNYINIYFFLSDLYIFIVFFVSKNIINLSISQKTQEFLQNQINISIVKYLHRGRASHLPSESKIDPLNISKLMRLKPPLIVAHIYIPRKHITWEMIQDDLWSTLCIECDFSPTQTTELVSSRVHDGLRLEYDDDDEWN